MTVNTPPSVNGEHHDGQPVPSTLEAALQRRAAEQAHATAQLTAVTPYTAAVAPTAHAAPTATAPSPAGHVPVDDPGVAARRVIRGPFRVIVGLLLLFAVIVALCAEAAYLWSSSKTDVWAARTEIQYVGGAWVETQAEALRSESLFRPVAEAEGIDTVDFLENLTAGQVPGTEVLAIEYHDEDPNLALRVVTNYSNLFMQRFEVPDVSDEEIAISTQLEPLELRLEEVIAADLAAGLENDGDAPTDEQVILRAEANQLRIDIGGLREQLTAAELARIDLADNQPTVIEAPFVLDEPVEPQPVKRAILGGLLGAVIGSVVLFVLVWRVL